MPLVRKPLAPRPAPTVDPSVALTALANGTEDERWAAARAVSEMPGGSKALAEALVHESNPRVREAIFSGLARSSTAESIELMLPFVRSDDAHLRTGALDALRTMKGAGRACLPQLLRDPDADVRLLACEIAREMPSEEAAPLLCELLAAEREVNVCASAIEVLAEVGAPEALPVLAGCAERFRGIEFLQFAIKIAAERIRSQSSSP